MVNLFTRGTLLLLELGPAHIHDYHESDGRPNVEICTLLRGITDMVSSANRGPETLTRSSAASPLAPPPGPQGNSELPLAKDAIIVFAVKAVAALLKESKLLAKEPEPSPFFSILSKLLLNAEEHLCRRSSLTELRVSRLLVDLERLAKANISYIIFAVCRPC